MTSLVNQLIFEYFKTCQVFLNQNMLKKLLLHWLGFSLHPSIAPHLMCKILSFDSWHTSKSYGAKNCNIKRRMTWKGVSYPCCVLWLFQSFPSIVYDYFKHCRHLIVKNWISSNQVFDSKGTFNALWLSCNGEVEMINIHFWQKTLTFTF